MVNINNFYLQFLGVGLFEDPLEAFDGLFILSTTSNYPDVSLESY